MGVNIFEPKKRIQCWDSGGAGRYISDDFRECFELECESLKRVRNNMDLTNVQLMIPFVRTIEEAKNVVALLEQKMGLKGGRMRLKF